MDDCDDRADHNLDELLAMMHDDNGNSDGCEQGDEEELEPSRDEVAQASLRIEALKRLLREEEDRLRLASRGRSDTCESAESTSSHEFELSEATNFPPKPPQSRTDPAPPHTPRSLARGAVCDGPGDSDTASRSAAAQPPSIDHPHLARNQTTTPPPKQPAISLAEMLEPSIQRLAATSERKEAMRKDFSLLRARLDNTAANSIPSPSPSPSASPAARPAAASTPERKPPALPTLPTPPKTPASESAKSAGGDVEEFSGLRIRNRLVSTTTLRERMKGRTFVKASSLSRHCQGILHLQKSAASLSATIASAAKVGEWVAIGVLGEKSEPRKTEKGQNYSIWNFTDLGGSSFVLFLFADVFETHWKEAEGSVFALLNPEVLPPKSSVGSATRSAPASAHATLKVDHPGKLMKLGTSVDYGVCKSIRKDGKKCSMVINTREGEYCEYHVAKAYSKLRSQRMEFNTGYGPGIVPANPSEKSLRGKNANAGATPPNFWMHSEGSILDMSLPSASKVGRDDKQHASQAPSLDKDPLLRGYLGRSDVSIHSEGARLKVLQTEQQSSPQSSQLSGEESSAMQTLLSKLGPAARHALRGVNATDSARTSSQLSSAPSASSADHLLAPVVPMDSAFVKSLGFDPYKKQHSNQSDKPEDEGSVHDVNERTLAMFAGLKREIRTARDGSTPRALPSEDLITNTLKAVAFVKAHGPLQKIDPNNPLKFSAKRTSSQAEGARDTARKDAKVSLDDAEDASAARDFVRAQKKSRLGTAFGVLDATSAKAISQSRSTHADAADNKELLDLSKKIEFLEKKDQMATKLANMKEMQVDGYFCPTCKYSDEIPHELCRKERHRLQKKKCVKRWFECQSCTHRRFTIDLAYPVDACRNCDSERYIQVGMQSYKQQSHSMMTSSPLLM